MDTKWLDGDLCANSWTRVTCDSSDLNVIKVDISGIAPGGGTLPSELGALSAATRLNLD